MLFPPRKSSPYSPTGLGQYFAIIDAISQDATPNRLYIYVLNVCVLADNIGLEVFNILADHSPRNIPVCLKLATTG